MPIVSFKVVPIVGEASVSKYITRAVEVLIEEGFNPIVTPDTTVVSVDDLSRIGGAAARIHEELAKMGVGRIVTIIMIDDRRDKPARDPMELVQSVESKLGERGKS